MWGNPGRPWQTCYAGLAPHETRKIVLEVGGVSSEEAAAIAALIRPAVAAPAVANAQSYVCVMSLDDLAERVVFTSMDRWDCPIWAPDGQSLLCSNQGKLHRLPLSGEPPQDFSTGAVSPSRDYALTADGRRLAFTAGDAIYVVPADGGEPAPILPTKQGYLHGWSPDGRTIFYCAGRNGGTMSIYSRLADGGEETRLLDVERLERLPRGVAGRQMDLFHLRQVGQAGRLADARLRRRAGRRAGPAGHQRRLPRLVPAPVAGRQMAAVPLQRGAGQERHTG